MLGLTPLGVFHTAISLIAVAAGLVALVRDKSISAKNSTGKIYIITTAITCLSGFGIFQHGGFGRPHELGIVTLAALGVAFAAGAGVFGRLSAYVETVGYSMTFLFNIIAGVNETATRLPPGAPLVASLDAPEMQTAVAVLFGVFLAGATWQVLRMRRRS